MFLVHSYFCLVHLKLAYFEWDGLFGLWRMSCHECARGCECTVVMICNVTCVDESAALYLKLIAIERILCPNGTKFITALLFNTHAKCEGDRMYDIPDMWFLELLDEYAFTYGTEPWIAPHRMCCPWIHWFEWVCEWVNGNNLYCKVLLVVIKTRKASI